MIELEPAIFRAYDIRGVADRDLGDALVHALGRAFATFIGRRGGGRRIAIGRDCRLTSPRLFAALAAGAQDSGAEVIDIGVVPSPVLYFAAHHLKTDGAVIITGSHNPAPDNGFKLLAGKRTLHSQDIVTLRESVETGDFDAGQGSMTRADVRDAYLANACSSIELGPRRMRVVVDGGNGTGGPLGVELYRRLGFDVVPLHAEPDGRFPAHHPDPTVEANLADLRRAVAETGAELGIAFDGDADRLGVIDGQGRVLWGDQLMLLFGLDILAEAPGARFIAEVKCSQSLFDGLRAAGGDAIMWKVGHSLIKAKMIETGAALAGEMSGHLFFAHRYLGFDDGIYAGARLLELLSKGRSTLAERRDLLPVTHTTPEIRVPCSDASKHQVADGAARRLRAHPEVREVIDIDGARARFDSGWGLVRVSNTQPALVVRAEASSPEALAAIRRALEDAIADAKEHP